MLLQVAMCTLFAQKNEFKREQSSLEFNPIKDNKEYKGYVIKLIPALPNPNNLFSYGFKILGKNMPVLHQDKNPVPSIAIGIQNKEDAYKIAEWIINNYKKTRIWKDTLSEQEAQEINIITK